MLAVIAYGVAMVFLLGVVPAMVICVLKGRFAMLFAGFLTFGLVWWIGALSGESRRRLGLTATGLACAVLALGVVGARPGQFVGVDGHALQGSVGGHFLTNAEACRRLSGADWTCERWSNEASGDVAYHVHVGSLGCWRGVLAERRGTSDPGQISGCVHIDDYL